MKQAELKVQSFNENFKDREKLDLEEKRQKEEAAFESINEKLQAKELELLVSASE
jgi:hypothetical protein